MLYHNLSIFLSYRTFYYVYWKSPIKNLHTKFLYQIQSKSPIKISLSNLHTKFVYQISNQKSPYKISLSNLHTKFVYQISNQKSMYQFYLEEKRNFCFMLILFIFHRYKNYGCTTVFANETYKTYTHQKLKSIPLPVG